MVPQGITAGIRAGISAIIPPGTAPWISVGIHLGILSWIPLRTLSSRDFSGDPPLKKYLWMPSINSHGITDASKNFFGDLDFFSGVSGGFLLGFLREYLLALLQEIILWFFFAISLEILAFPGIYAKNCKYLWRNSKDSPGIALDILPELSSGISPYLSGNFIYNHNTDYFRDFNRNRSNGSSVVPRLIFPTIPPEISPRIAPEISFGNF